MNCENSPLMHKHHIIPRYMGGTDAAGNLVEVTVTQHAMYHFCNFQLWGNTEDWAAWRGLTGQVGKEEILSVLNRENQAKAVEAARTPEIIEKKKQKFKEINHQQGEKNSQYGKMWITDGTKEGSYRIDKGDPIPKGYRPGRVSRNEENINFIFMITTPSGKVIKTKRMYQFCMENNLSCDVMLKLSKGKGKQHKGYTVCRELLDTTHPHLV